MVQKLGYPIVARLSRLQVMVFQEFTRGMLLSPTSSKVVPLVARSSSSSSRCCRRRHGRCEHDTKEAEADNIVPI